MKLYDDAVLDAAASREAGDSAGAWKLADALLAKIPAGTPGRKGGDVAPVSDGLQQYATKLNEENICTPAGGPYSASTLDDLRDVAMAWPTDKRHPQAAFRTHQEAVRPDSDNGKVLRTLCRYAAGEIKSTSTIDSKSWAEATEIVDRLIKRRAKYTVSANALRLAVGRKKNTPVRDDVVAPAPFEPVTATSVAAAAKSLPTPERTALARELAADPQTRKDVETAVREVKSDELAAAHRRVMEEHGGKRKSGLGGGADDAPKHVVTEQPLAVLGVLIETEGFKDALPKVIRIVSDKRELLAEDDFEYLREWSTTMRQHLDTLDELLKLGTGLTDEAIEGLLKGE
jgi:hypothetical protein